MGCLLLLGACVLGLGFMFFAMSTFGVTTGFAISTFFNMLLLGGWLLYLFRSGRDDEDDLAEDEAS